MISPYFKCWRSLRSKSNKIILKSFKCFIKVPSWLMMDYKILRDFERSDHSFNFICINDSLTAHYTVINVPIHPAQHLLGRVLLWLIHDNSCSYTANITKGSDNSRFPQLFSHDSLSPLSTPVEPAREQNDVCHRGGLQSGADWWQHEG